MTYLNDTISSLKPSPTLAITAKAQQLKSDGVDIVSFGAGEPDFDTPDHIKNAAKEALDKGITKYAPVGGTAALKEAVRKKLADDQGVSYSNSQIIISNGGKQAIAALFAVTLNPGDEVIIPAPYWTSYPDMVQLAGGKPVVVETTPEDGFLMSASSLESAITDRTRFVIINSPSNPTGACYSKEALVELGGVIKKKINSGSNLLVMSDEVYEYITYDGFVHVSIVEACPELADHTVIVNAFSKTYSMTGWRVGYAAGPEEVIKGMTTHQSQFTSGVCSIAQYAASKAYSDELAFPKMMQAEFNVRMDLLCHLVKKMKGISLAQKPQGAFYGFLLVDELLGKSSGKITIQSGADLATFLLDEYQVAVVPGDAFGYANAFRISFALDIASLEKGLARIAEAADCFS